VAQGYRPKPEPRPLEGPPCLTCRWCSHRDNWWTRFWDSHLNAICLNPIVNGTLPNARQEGWMLLDYIDGGPIYPADPVTGRPLRVVAPCSLIRQDTYRPPINGNECRRATANCGPEARYWEART